MLIYGINKEVDKYIDFKRSRRELSVEKIMDRKPKIFINRKKIVCITRK
jgi:hypothetical protein